MNGVNRADGFAGRVALAIRGPLMTLLRDWNNRGTEAGTFFNTLLLIVSCLLIIPWLYSCAFIYK